MKPVRDALLAVPDPHLFRCSAAPALMLRCYEQKDVFTAATMAAPITSSVP